MLPHDSTDSPETERLLMKIRSGDRHAFNELFDRYRDRLKQAVNRRLDPALNARFDASDVVQEAQLEVYRRLDDYLDRRPMPFGVWIRKTVHERLQKLRRAHLETKGRSVSREQRLPDRSSMLIASQIRLSDTSVRGRLEKREYERLVRDTVDELGELDREILLMRVVEGLMHSEIAQILDVSSDAVRKRYGRALIKLERRLSEKGLSRSDS